MLTITRLSSSEIILEIAATACLLAMIGNTVSKAVLASIIGGPALGGRLVFWLLAAIASGLGLNAYLP